MHDAPLETASTAQSAAPHTRRGQFHLALGRAVELEQIACEAQQGLCPRHVMGQIAGKLEAVVHRPSPTRGTFADRLRSRLAGRPEHWELARKLAHELERDDEAVLFCTGEDIGIPSAALGKRRGGGPRIAMFVHNLDRPRGRAAARLLRLERRIDLFVTNVTRQAEFLRRYLHLGPDRVWLLLDQTDTRFFTPGPATLPKSRPIVASVGLEKRDYRTLAAATHDLPLEVRISGFSQDAVTLSRAFPDVLPANMTRRFYAWPELVQLYRAADVVVVSLFENNYSAGVNALLEAWACRRPVIVTGTTGLKEDYLTDYQHESVAAIVPPGDAPRLRAAILELLNDPDRAAALAEAGYRRVTAQHNSEDYCRRMATRLERLAE